MGVVYLATHTRLGRRVAIKVLRPQYANDPPMRRRFFAEARAVNQIAHQNIIEITDFVERPGEANYYVMELLEGVDLAELVAVGGMLALERTVAIMTQLAQALGAVHRAGIAHLDVKPQNILLLERGGRSDFVKLVDFGIARTIEMFDETTWIPETMGGELGTPRYMSPEHAAGLPVDYRSDTYSFGVTFYELVTGRPPFDGAERTPPAAIAGIPKPLETLILACLQPDPRNRPARMEDISERLVAIAAEQGWGASAMLTPSHLRAMTPEPAPAPAPAPPRARSKWGLVAGAALAGVIAAALVIRFRGSPDRAAKVRAELALADERLAAGRVVAPDKDGALDHLLAARALDPDDPGVRERLDAIARKYEQLANEAFAAGSLPEAAAHLQTVLVIEPHNEAASAKMNEIEAEILVRQRIPPVVD